MHALRFFDGSDVVLNKSVSVVLREVVVINDDADCHLVKDGMVEGL